MKILNLVFGLILSFSISVLAEENRHPRVLGIEQRLSKEVTEILKAMFPSKPNSVWVQVDPLRRVSAADNGKESLPFYEANEEIRDEWDDPDKSDYDLLARVNKIYFKISLPSDLSQEQVEEAKTSIFQSLRLVQGRDFIEITQKAWMVNKPPVDYTPWVMGIGVALILIFGVIYFVVNSISIARITKAIRNIKIQQAESSGNSGGPSGAIASPSAESNNKTANAGSGDLRLNDPIKIAEVLNTLVHTIEQNSLFPDLFDMMTLERACKEDPKSVGAMLLEFPDHLRNKIFSYSYSARWLEAFTNPGELKLSSIELLNRLSKNVRTEETKEWQELLIYCWRLDKGMAGFLKTLPYDHAIAILSGLPRSISLPVAREIVPGNWGILLKADFKPKAIEKDKIEIYKTKALSLLPLRTLKLIAEYKREVDLIDYLHLADPQVERDIYGASSSDSYIHKTRPPFFKVLDATEVEIRKMTSQVSLEEWAVSLLNVPKSYRMTIETCFSERQKFRFIELLKYFDKNPPTAYQIGEHREKIARIYDHLIQDERVIEGLHQSKDKAAA